MNKQSIRKAVSRWADRTGGVSPTAQARLVEELARNLEAAPAPAPAAPVLSADGVSAIEECILLAGMHGSTREMATRAAAELEYLHALVDKGRQDSEALKSHLSRSYRGSNG